MDPSFGKLLPTNLDARNFGYWLRDGPVSMLFEIKGLPKPYGVELSPEQVDFCQKTVNSNGYSFLT